MHIDDNADAKRILLASPPADWRRQLGRPHITWLSTVQQDLKQHHLTLPEAADLAQNRPLWRIIIIIIINEKINVAFSRRTARTRNSHKKNKTRENVVSNSTEEEKIVMKMMSMMMSTYGTTQS